MSEQRPKSTSAKRSSAAARVAKSTRQAAMSPGRIQRESVETRRTAALILEVLAGVRTTGEAAEILGVSATRYYVLEARALEGLLHACRRRERGPRRSPEREIARLKRELARAGRDRDRAQALLRLAERTIGMPARSSKAASSSSSSSGSAAAKPRRKRRPVARALRAVKVLQSAAENPVDAAEPAGQHEAQVES